MTTPACKMQAEGSRPPLPFVLLACFAILGLAGCGDDYRAQVEKTRQRMALLDEENALLEEPAHLPGDTAVYFRPPRGVSMQRREKSYPPSDWFHHLSWNERHNLVPPFEILVGATKKEPGKSLEDFVNTTVLDYLRLHADERLTPRAGESPHDLTVLRQSDSPHQRWPIVYRHYAYRSEQELPQWPAPERPKLPARCSYDYDIYVTDAEEFWGVVVFKTLNLEATREAWQKARIRPEEVLKLPQRMVLGVDQTKKLNARETSLSTLLIGARAKARLRLIGR